MTAKFLSPRWQRVTAGTGPVECASLLPPAALGEASPFDRDGAITVHVQVSVVFDDLR